MFEFYQGVLKNSVVMRWVRLAMVKFSRVLLSKHAHAAVQTFLAVTGRSSVAKNPDCKYNCLGVVVLNPKPDYEERLTAFYRKVSPGG